jgi:hypothetical protein
MAGLSWRSSAVSTEKVIPPTLQISKSLSPHNSRLFIVTVTILDINQRGLLFKTRRLGDFILSLSSCGTYSVGPDG